MQQPTQLDMSLAQFGFIGYVMISSEFLGIKTTREEMEGLVHVWRVIGNMLGMEEKFVVSTSFLCTSLHDDHSKSCFSMLKYFTNYTENKS